ncbi:hypothetical protein DPMN_031210 [Dreissena polymorpha]|uniref:Uncharacterized protein n=1 Tax=Dreissena polymorpha TaxID=45954 RepID=A0A9D4M0I7_DREPO|nr:hypothetical protein DPMN_031210 [Dreissena polymorpha]
MFNKRSKIRRTQNKNDKGKKPAKKRPIITVMPSTNTMYGYEDSEADIDYDDDDDHVCCDQRQPQHMNDRAHLKIFSWGQCDLCGHLVHLAFCHEKRV